VVHSFKNWQSNSNAVKGARAGLMLPAHNWGPLTTELKKKTPRAEDILHSEYIFSINVYVDSTQKMGLIFSFIFIFFIFTKS
jgi:hypothetical protein